MTKNSTTYQVTEKLFWIASLLHHKNTQLTFNTHMIGSLFFKKTNNAINDF